LSSAPAGEAVRVSLTPKPPRLLHAFPDDSNVALCGVRHTGGPVLINGKPCPRCRDEAGRRFWGAR
jgi:hypothetical protein